MIKKHCIFYQESTQVYQEMFFQKIKIQQNAHVKYPIFIRAKIRAKINKLVLTVINNFSR